MSWTSAGYLATDEDSFCNNLRIYDKNLHDISFLALMSRTYAVSTNLYTKFQLM